MQQVFAGLTPELVAPVSLQQAPGDATRWFVVEQAGTIRVFANEDGVSATLSFLDITGRVRSGGERGLLGMAFHPDFPNTPDVFVSYTRQPDGTSHVSRFTSTDGGQTWQPAAVGHEPGAAQDLFFSPAFPNDQTAYLLLQPESGTSLSLQRSADAGRSWESLLD